MCLSDDDDLEEKEEESSSNHRMAVRNKNTPSIPLDNNNNNNNNIMDHPNQNNLMEENTSLSTKSESVMACEYRMFVKAVLDLLDERDIQDYTIATEGDLTLCDAYAHQQISILEVDDSYEQDSNVNESLPAKPMHLSLPASPHSVDVLSPMSASSLALATASPPPCKIVKAGPLRKASYLMRSGWKMKYVEVRKGQFTYYDDDKNTENSEKVIPLIANRSTCRAVKLKKTVVDLSIGSDIDHPESAACFEICYDNGPKRLWMVHSKEERKSWLQAIHEAMVGRSATRSDNFFEYEAAVYDHRKTGIPSSSPYRDQMEDYLIAQKAITEAKTKEQYVSALLRYQNDIAMTVPVEWVKNYFHKSKTKFHKRDPSAFIEEVISSSVSQLWKDLQRDSVSINGNIYRGNDETILEGGAERIVGALARCIMDFDKSSPFSRSKSRISEIQSIAFARDILLACNRTRSSGDLYFCMETLCTQPNLVVLCPSSNVASPLSIEVSHVNNNDSFHSFGLNERKSWIKTRSGVNKSWEMSFCILSEAGILSYYGEELPIPHRLKGQIILVGAGLGENKPPASSVEEPRATIREIDTTYAETLHSNEDNNNRSSGNINRYILYIYSKHRGRELHLSFDSEEEFSSWRRTLRKVIKRCNADDELSRHQSNSFSKEKYMDSLLQATAEKLKKLKLRQISFSENNRPDIFDVIRRDANGVVATKPRDKKTHKRHRSLPGFSFFDAKLKGSRHNKTSSQIPYTLPVPLASANTSILPKPDAGGIKRSATAGATIGNDKMNEPLRINTDDLDDSSKKNSQTLGIVPCNLTEADSNQDGSSFCTTDQLDVDINRRAQLTSVKSIPSMNWSKRCPTVRVNVRVSSNFKICTIDPEGSNEDTWANVNMTLLQNFLLRGGSHGKIVRGEELAQIDCCSPNMATIFSNQKLPLDDES